MRAGLLGYLHPAQHARDFFDTLAYPGVSIRDSVAPLTVSLLTRK